MKQSSRNLIRRGLLSRDDAIALVSMNDGLYPSEYLGKSLKSILSEFAITMSEFEQSCDDFTNYDLFKTDNNGALIKRPRRIKLHATSVARLKPNLRYF